MPTKCSRRRCLPVVIGCPRLSRWSVQYHQDVSGILTHYLIDSFVHSMKKRKGEKNLRGRPYSRAALKAASVAAVVLQRHSITQYSVHWPFGLRSDAAKRHSACVLRCSCLSTPAFIPIERQQNLREGSDSTQRLDECMTIVSVTCCDAEMCKGSPSRC